jgi:hypothetical protein
MSVTASIAAVMVLLIIVSTHRDSLFENSPAEISPDQTSTGRGDDLNAAMNFSAAGERLRKAIRLAVSP